MKDNKNFFYRINPCEVLAEVIFADNKEKWFLQFFSDLKNDDPCRAQLDLSKQIITEAHGFRAKRAVAGKASAEQRANIKQHMLTDAATQSQQTANTIQPVAVAETKAVTETKVKRFVPPSVPEVVEYMKEIGFNGDAQNFVDSNIAKGWVVGTTKTPMKCWKAAIRTWQNKHLERIQTQQPTQQPAPDLARLEKFRQAAEE